MNRYFYLFVIAIILGAIGGYYFHEGINEKITYERNSCYDLMSVVDQERMYKNINNYSEMVIYGTEK